MAAVVDQRAAREERLPLPVDRLNRLLGIPVPIVQAGMTWVSRHELAAAVSGAGGLGVIGSGGMDPELRTVA